MRKNLLLLAIAMSASIPMYSQVGINTSTPQAMLHVKNTGTNANPSALRVEGEIQVKSEDITPTYRKLYLNANKDLVSGPGDAVSFKLLSGFTASTDAGATYTTADLGSEIRRVIFNNIRFQNNTGSYNTSTGIFTASDSGYYKIEVGLLLRNANNVAVNTTQLRLGVSVANQTNFQNGNASFAFLTQRLNQSSGSSIPECIQIDGVIYLTAGDQIAVGTRYADPVSWPINTELINYKRENVNYFTITYLVR